MGVPKFFRWLSERYPKINQRYGSPPNPETRERYFKDNDIDNNNNNETDSNDASSSSSSSFSFDPLPESPDPLSSCGLPPEIDRLYLDMNGIIHGCSHNNSDPDDEDISTNSSTSTSTSNENSFSGKTTITNPEIFRNVCYYLDRIIGDIVQPKQVVYMAIDGVAPRAKLNQQRSRRYRSGQEGAIEMNIYEAHAKAMKQQQQQLDGDGYDTVYGFDIVDGNNDDSNIWSGELKIDKQSVGNSKNAAFDVEDGYSMEWENTMELSENKKKKKQVSAEYGSGNYEQQHQQQHGSDLQEVAPGRFTGKFEIQTKDERDPSGNDGRTLTGRSGSGSGGKGAVYDRDDNVEYGFHHNVITPGTDFFNEFTRHLEHFVKYKISTDPKWQHLSIIISGPKVPGEGEHKIMQFIREQRALPNYDPNLRHCIMGQDGDLIMLGLATHEPNLVLLRERVLFSQTKHKLNLAAVKNPLDLYIHNGHFEFLHMGVLRDYLAYEFATDSVAKTGYDLERTIDDFVFMTFFVGNDFLPHMPALDIADDAFDLLFMTYKQMRRNLRRKGKRSPYLTNAGTIVSGQRLEQFLSAVGSYENSYYDKKKQSSEKDHRRLKREYKRFGFESALPDKELVASKEQADREAYRNMLQQQHMKANGDSIMGEDKFMPVMNSDIGFEPEEDDEKELEASFMSRMGSILQNSLSNLVDDDDNEARRLSIDDQDLKGRYYYDKFQFTPFDAEKHLALRKAYVEGLVWNLKYYYEGCISWEWYYPYHYGPMLSDLVGLDDILEEISFVGKEGAPLKPFEQLLGCMPPSQSHILPKPYRWLMTDPKSPIYDFYPKSFTIDMNGKRWPWEAVVLLPFIDSKRLLDAVATIDESKLTDAEKERNSFDKAIVLEYDPTASTTLPEIGTTEGFRAIGQNKTKITSLEESTWRFDSSKVPVLQPELLNGVKVPLPGFGSLRDAPIQNLLRKKLGLNIFGTRSRYETSCLEMSSIEEKSKRSIEEVASELIGKTIYINYPYFLEALVTAVSDDTASIRGHNEPNKWTDREKTLYLITTHGMGKILEAGEGYTGTGGLIIPGDANMTLTVRPFKGFVQDENGNTVKSYAEFSIDVPYINALWHPSNPDTRLSSVPPLIEPDAYEIAVPLNEYVTTQVKKPLFPPRAKTDAQNSTNGMFRRSKNTRRRQSPKRSKGEGQTSSHSFFPSRSDAGNAVGGARKSLLPPRRASVARRDFATFAPSSTWNEKISTEAGRFHAANYGSTVSKKECVHYASSRTNLKSKSGVRGRMIAAGVVAAGFLFQSTSGTMTDRSANTITKVSSLVSKYPTGQNSSPLADYLLGDIRGGDIEYGFQPAESSSSSSVPPLEFAHGTTTISFTFQGGIIAAVDSRASLGSFVGSKTVEKVLPVNSHILGTMAGGAADCMFWIRKLKSEALLHELTESRRMTVARASRLLSNALYQNRGLGLSVGTMIMGFDEDNTPKIYYVDNTGVRIEGDQFAVGSGSTFALGILDTERHYDLSEEDAITLGIKAIRHATFRDAYSGGFINVFLITKDGWRKVFTDDLAGFERNTDLSK